MNRLLANRLSLKFNTLNEIFLVIKKTNDFGLNKNKAAWIRNNLNENEKIDFTKWIEKQNINDTDILDTSFEIEIQIENRVNDEFICKLDNRSMLRFSEELLKQELGRHFIKKGFFVNPIKSFGCWSVYQKISEFDINYDRYRIIYFNWKLKRSELTFNFKSEKVLISKDTKFTEEGSFAFNTETMIVHKMHGGMKAKMRCPEEISRAHRTAPKKFDYKERFEKLNDFAKSNLFNFESLFFTFEKAGFKYVAPNDLGNVTRQKNLMNFGNDKSAINAVVGMREFGPYKKLDDPEKKRLLFIYQNRNDANTLYRYLKNGLKQFPGLLTYVGIPVALAEPIKGLPYDNANELPNHLNIFLDSFYPNSLYPDVLAIVIGPYKRYESNNEESESYYQIKKILLEKGIVSQFVCQDTINSYGVHYSLPNIAVAILSKFGGIPWKLSGKPKKELIVGFNTKITGDNRYLGSAVFFDNEGKLGAVKAFPLSDRMAVINGLKSSIVDYKNNSETLDRLIIHYYKPPRKGEIQKFLDLLENLAIEIPIAVVEINDHKSKLDICFDTEYEMGMPESGVYVRVGYSEYLLFNNNRYVKNPTQKIDNELPIKLTLHFVSSGGFTISELISQVYEFSRLNWKGLKQRSVPVTTLYSKTVAEFSSYFKGNIPQNIVANSKPWFI